VVFEIKVLERKANTLNILIKGASTELMNALRRAILTEVPTLAIEEVTFFDNNSVVFDEMLAHRLALLPIKTSLKTLKKGESVKLWIEKEGPGTAYSKDIKSSDPDIEIIGKKIPLTKLAKGQKIKAEMLAVLNSGKEHAKWQPAIVGYRQVNKITINGECDLCEACIKECPKNILEAKGKKIVLTDALECDACNACRNNCEKGLISIVPEEGSFVLFLETHGQLENEEILYSAIEALSKKTTEFKKEISSLKE